MPKLTSKGKRSFTYSTIIVFILVVFALGYIFYFIPHNRATLHKNGFIILRTISDNFDKAVSARMELFKNFTKSSIPASELLAQNGINGSIQDSQVSKGSVYESFDIIGDSLNIEVGNGKHIFRFRERFDEFFDTLVLSQKKELFRFYDVVLLHNDSARLIYHDQQFAILDRKGADSILLGGKNAITPGITDFSAENSDFKMFSYPCKVHTRPFVISGFLDSGEYNQLIRVVPFYFIFPLVVIFLLVLIGLPVIKFYVMDSNEPMGANDVFFFGGSAILGATLLTLMIIQFLLWKGEEIRVEQNLSKISSQITRSFFNELRLATQEIIELDAFRRDSTRKDSDISSRLQEYIRTRGDVNSSYLQFDRISWVDDSSRQKIKGDLYRAPVYTKVNQRKYFRIFKTGTPYQLPGNEKIRFVWEPIYSVTNGELSISISMKLHDTIVAMASKMYSVMQTIVPAGYGFCIIDPEGDVQIHSETDRSLRENFLEKTDKPNEIRSFMRSRQKKIINNVSLYNRQCTILVQPLDSMPFYLVAFHDKSHIVSVNMRILVFSLLLTILFFAVVGIMWLIYGPAGVHSHPLVYCKMDLLDWATPKRKLAPYYFHAFIYVTVYFFSIAGFVVFSNFYDISNSDIITLVLITPYNILVTLSYIRSACNEEGASMNQALIHLALSFFIFYLSGPLFHLDAGFILFQLVVNLILWLYWRWVRIHLEPAPKDGSIFFWTYKLLITSLVVCFSVLPAAVFTWYAHNQEITQSVKRQQLYLVNNLRDRSLAIENSNQRRKNLLKAAYFDTIEFSKGIYPLFDDEINQVDEENGHDSGHVVRKTATQFGEFYSALMEKVDVSNYDTNSLTQLRDDNYDKSWSWWIDNKSLHFFWPKGRVSRNTTGAISIVSTIPRRFVYLTPEKYLPVAVITLLLLMGLFSWMGRNSETIFLTNFTHRYLQNNPKSHKYLDTASMDFPPGYDKLKLGLSREKLAKYEQELIRDMDAREGFYQGVWTSLNDKERFLVYSFAKEGIVNYKNVLDIINLIDKGILVLDLEEERLRIFSPGFRAFVISVIPNKDIKELQVSHVRDSTWRSFRVPLLTLLLGIVALVFFTQHGVFEQLLLLAGGLTTLLNFVTGFFAGGGKKATVQ